MIWMGSTPSKLSNKSKITQFEARMKKIRPCDVKRRFSKTPHLEPLNVCAFSIYLVASNDSKIDINRFYSLLAFLRDKKSLHLGVEKESYDHLKSEGVCHGEAIVRCSKGFHQGESAFALPWKTRAMQRRKLLVR